MTALRRIADTAEAFASLVLFSVDTARRMDEIARLSAVVSDRAEAERLHGMVRRVAVGEAMMSPYVNGDTRIRQYLEAVHDMAARGEPLPQSDDDLRQIPAAAEWRLMDMARAMGVAVE